MSLDDVARVTKIQPRILERLESGKADGLPADVFVRGFVRSFARCVGLSEDEALERYSACGASDGSAKAPMTARAMVEVMADLAPATAEAAADAEVIEFAAGSLEIPVPSVEASQELAPVEAANDVIVDEQPVEAEAVSVETPVVEQPAVVTAPPADMDLTALDAPAPAPSKKTKRARRAAGTTAPAKPRKRKRLATGTPVEASPVVEASEAPVETEAPVVETASVEAPVVETAGVDAVFETASVVETESLEAPTVEMAGFPTSDVDATVEPPSGDVDASSASDEEPASTAVCASDAQPIEVIDATASGQWTPRMPPLTASTPWRRATAAPALVAVIDDADPDSAERALEDRRDKESRRTFLPPILLDREDRSRQGGLTLAVIILLIAATLTLSYLMRRPSASGDGVTQAAASLRDLA